MQAVLLVGGKGSRLGHLTKDTPKPLLPVGGQPFIYYLLENLKRSGFTNIVLLVGPFLEKYQEVLGSSLPSGMTIDFVTEDAPAGTAGALCYAEKCLDDKFLFLNGDSYFGINYLDLMDHQEPGPCMIRLALRRVEDSSRYGTVELDNDRITGFYEKRAGGGGLINAGVYWVKREILREIVTLPSSLENDVLPRLSSQGLVRGYVFEGDFIDIGTPEDFQRADTLMPSITSRP